MATYNVSFNLANEITGTQNPYVLSNNTGRYPQIYLQSNGQYGVSRVNVSPFLNPATNGTTDAPTIYIKQGDTINVSPVNPGQTNYNSLYQALTATESEPDPTSPTSWPVASGTTHTLQYPSSGTDLETTWYYFGAPDTLVNGATQFTKSAMVKIYVVKVGSLTLNGSTSTQTVAGTGGTLSVAANNIDGLKTTVGTTNRLYLHVRNSSNQVVFSNVSFFGATNPFLGIITTGTTSSTLTISSALPAGDYKVYIGHFGGNGQGSGLTGNPFYGSDNIIAEANFTKTAADTTPDSFSLGSDQTNLETGQEFTTSQFTISGINAAASISVSGGGSPQFSIGGGSFTNSSTTVTNGQTVRLRMYTSGSYSTAVTGTLNIGGVTDSLTLTTKADPGGSTQGASGTSNYGVKVVNSSTNEILGPNSKVGNIIATGSATVPARTSGQTFNTLVLPVGGGTFEGVTSTNQTQIDLLTLLNLNPLIASQLTIERGDGSNGASEGQFLLKNYFFSAVPLVFYVIRTS